MRMRVGRWGSRLPVGDDDGIMVLGGAFMWVGGMGSEACGCGWSYRMGCKYWMLMLASDCLVSQVRVPSGIMLLI